jgi:hypothetical protein
MEPGFQPPEGSRLMALIDEYEQMAAQLETMAAQLERCRAA